MILQRLVEYYDRLVADPAEGGKLPAAGYSVQKIGFCVVLNPDGSLRQVDSLLDENERPVNRLVPGNAKPTGQGINPGFLWDNSAYMLGLKKDDKKPERTRLSFEAFRDRHLAAEKFIDSHAFRAVCAFLRAWNPDDAASVLPDADDLPAFGVFRLVGERYYADEDLAVRRYWDTTTSGDPDWEGVSLIDGQHGSVARIHEPKIKGAGGQSSGTLLVSFNEPAYESYGREQSYNAPVSRTQAFRYANALNYLLGRRDRRLSLGDMTVVFWAERAVALENFVSDLLGDASDAGDDAPIEDRRRAEQVSLFLSQLRAGAMISDALDSSDTVPFFILGLSPNASRLSVRIWEQTTVAGIRRRLAQHINDLALFSARESEPPLVLRRIVQATGRATDDFGYRFDVDAVSPRLAGEVARAVLGGGPYPASLLVAMVNRLRADRVICHARVAAIKACLVRNSRIRGNPMEVSVSLDPHRSDPAYVMGRLFALLEKLQSDSAGGELNTTIKDRYFSSASATPGVVFPRLVRLSQHHLAKLEGGRRVYYERQIGEAVEKLNGFGSHLDLENQGLFAVGYYHQRQDLYTKKTQGDFE